MARASNQLLKRTAADGFAFLSASKNGTIGFDEAVGCAAAVVYFGRWALNADVPIMPMNVLSAVLRFICGLALIGAAYTTYNRTRAHVAAGEPIQIAGVTIGA